MCDEICVKKNDCNSIKIWKKDHSVYNLLLCYVLTMAEGSVCEIENQNGVVTLKPLPHTACTVNNRGVTEPCRLAQGKCKSQVLVYARVLGLL